MKVVILCGGKGERLREETEFRPKPLIEIGGMPILWHIMKIFSHYGHKDFILLLGYKGYMIKQFFLNFELMLNDFTLDLRNKNPVFFHRKEDLEDWKITFLDTGLNTNTGGRISRAKEFLKNEKDFFITYGDGVADIRLDQLIKFHREKKCIITLTGVKPSSPFGIIEMKDGIAVSFKEKPTLEGIVSGGFFVATPEIFRYLSDDENCIFEEEPLKRMASEKKLAVYLHEGFWAAMDTYKQVQVLNRLWESKNPPWRCW